MSENRLPDYLDHIQQAATDARSFVEGMAKDDFLADKRTQQAVIMSLIVIGEAADDWTDAEALASAFNTLLQGLSGMLQPVSGEVLLDGLALPVVEFFEMRRRHLSPACLRKISYPSDRRISP
mgnify:CR=1 FL=1